MFELHTQSDKSGNHFFDISYAHVPIPYFNAPLDLVVRYCGIRSGVLNLYGVCSDKFKLKGVSRREGGLEEAMVNGDSIVLGSNRYYLDDLEGEIANVVFIYDDKDQNKDGFEKTRESEIISGIVKKVNRITHFIATGKLKSPIELQENLTRMFKEKGIKQPPIDLLVEVMKSIGDYDIKDDGYTNEVMSLLKDEVCGVEDSPVIGKSGETFVDVISYITRNNQKEN